MSRLHHWPSRLGVYVCNFWETAKAQYLWREDFPSGLPGEETGKPHSPGTAPAETLGHRLINRIQTLAAASLTRAR